MGTCHSLVVAGTVITQNYRNSNANFCLICDCDSEGYILKGGGRVILDAACTLICSKLSQINTGLLLDTIGEKTLEERVILKTLYIFVHRPGY